MMMIQYDDMLQFEQIILKGWFSKIILTAYILDELEYM